MAKLKKEHKELIVKELACFGSVTDVQKKLKDTCNVEVDHNQISYYNPNNPSSSALSSKWVSLFHTTRRQYREEVAKHDIAHKGYRLGKLQKAAEELEKKGNYVGMAEMLEQAAKEVGGAFEAKELLTPPDRDAVNFFQQINQTIINQQNNKNGSG